MRGKSRMGFVGAGLLFVCLAFPAFATDYIVYTFDSDVAYPTSAWAYDNNTNAPWTGTIVGGQVHWALSEPLAATEEYRMYNNKKLPSYASTKIVDYPWAHVKMTLAGIPEGQTVTVMQRMKLCDSGGSEVNRRMHQIWEGVGNGTHIFSMFMGDSTNCIDGDENPTTFNADDRYYKAYVYLDITTVAGFDTPHWTEGDNPCENITADVDWIAYTDNYAYPTESPAPVGEIACDTNLAFLAAGMPVTLTAPDGSDYHWFRNGEALDETGQELVFAAVTVGDAGTYTCLYDDGSKELQETAPFELTVLAADGLPVAGIAGLALAAAALGLVAAKRMRRR